METILSHPGIPKLIALILVHLLFERYSSILLKHHRLVSSLGAGLAVSYVFLMLLPEINEGTNHIGSSIYFFILLGFVLYHLFEWSAHKTGIENKDKAFKIELLALAVYNATIMFATPMSLLEDIMPLVLLILVLAVHLIHANYMLSSRFPNRFNHRTTVILSAAVLFGFLLRFVFPIANEMIKDFSIAFLAGSIIYSVFRHELPSHKESHYAWFLAGITLLCTAVWFME